MMCCLLGEAGCCYHTDKARLSGMASIVCEQNRAGQGGLLGRLWWGARAQRKSAYHILLNVLYSLPIPILHAREYENQRRKNQRQARRPRQGRGVPHAPALIGRAPRQAHTRDGARPDPTNSRHEGRRGEAARTHSHSSWSD